MTRSGEWIHATAADGRPARLRIAGILAVVEQDAVHPPEGGAAQPAIEVCFYGGSVVVFGTVADFDRLTADG